MGPTLHEVSGLGHTTRKLRPVSFERALTCSGIGWIYSKESVGTAYFPRGDINVLSDLGYSLVLGGDFNAHTGSNGDKRPIGKAGRMFLNSIEDVGLVMINTLPGKCSGGPTRVQVHKDVTQESTLDYIICTPDMTSKVKSMQIMDTQMGSDHCPLVLALTDLTADPPPKTSHRLVWKKENIVSPEVGGGGNWSWVFAARAKLPNGSQA